MLSQARRLLAQLAPQVVQRHLRIGDTLDRATPRGGHATAASRMGSATSPTVTSCAIPSAGDQPPSALVLGRGSPAPSSRISPSTATVRASPAPARDLDEGLHRRAHAVGVGVVGVVDDDDAVRAGRDLHPPLRQRRGGLQRVGDRVELQSEPQRRPRLRPPRSSPGALRRTAGPGRPSGPARRGRSVVCPSPSSPTSLSRTSARVGHAERAAPVPKCGRPSPRRVGRPRSAPRARRRAAPRRARPWPGAMPSRLPNSPRWAKPDVEHEADLGPDDAREVGDVTGTAGAHLGHQVAGLRRDAQGGQRDADLVVQRVHRRHRLARTLRGSRASMSFVLVLPCEPVIPTTVRSGHLRQHLAWRAVPSASRTSATTTAGAPDRPGGRAPPAAPPA